MKQKSRYNTARKMLIFWTLSIGIGAVAGATGMLVDPTGKSMGMDAMLPFFKVLPFADVLFNDLFFSGIALLIVNGLSNLTAAVLLLKKKKLGVILGVTLMLWICIQFYIFPLNFMSTTYFIFGFLQAATGYAAYVFLKQETFTVNKGDYPNIGTGKAPLWFIFPEWDMQKSLPLKRPTGFAPIYMRSDPPRKPTEPQAFGGAAATECIGGICPSSRLKLTLKNTKRWLYAPPYGSFLFALPYAVFAKRRPEKSNRLITYSFTTPAENIFRQPRKRTKF